MLYSLDTFTLVPKFRYVSNIRMIRRSVSNTLSHISYSNRFKYLRWSELRLHPNCLINPHKLSITLVTCGDCNQSCLSMREQTNLPEESPMIMNTGITPTTLQLYHGLNLSISLHTLREESSQTNVILHYKLLASILSAVCIVLFYYFYYL